MRTTASKSARASNRQRDVDRRFGSTRGSTRTARRPPARAGRGSRAGTSRPNVDRVGSLSITNAAAATAYDPDELGQAGLAARAEEVGPPRVRRRRRTRPAAGSPGRCPGGTATFVAAGGCAGGPAPPGRGAARRRSPCAPSCGEQRAGGSRCRSPGRARRAPTRARSTAWPTRSCPSGSTARFSIS